MQVWDGLCATNREDRSFGLTICPERVGMRNAVAGDERDFVGIARTSDSNEPIATRRGCGHVLAGFNPDLMIVSAVVCGYRKFDGLSRLLHYRTVEF
jgi:cytidine deaminase